MRTITLLLGLLPLCLSFDVAAINKCLKADGKTYYSDLPCPGGYKNETPRQDDSAAMSSISELPGPAVFGLKLGMTKGQIAVQLPTHRRKITGDNFYLLNVQSGDVRAESLNCEVRDGKLHSIHALIDSYAYKLLYDKFYKDLGAPNEDDDAVVQNLMGAQFNAKRITWDFPNGSSLILSKNYGRVGSASLWYQAKDQRDPAYYNKQLEERTQGFGR